jgi:hypothetical protein
MSISTKALDHLKGKDNPFELLARPQLRDDNFRAQHVQELLRGDRQMLLDIIDWYRVQQYAGQDLLRPTRVVTVRGPRGSGKTHLLQSLIYRDDGKSQILIRPSHYATDPDFAEYLLAQLRNALIEPDEVYHGSPYEDIARTVTRRLLRQTIAAFEPTDYIFASSPPGWQRFRLLWKDGSSWVRRWQRLRDLLQDPNTTQDLPELLKRHDFDVKRCLRLIAGHVNRCEAGSDLPTLMRRQLFLALALTALEKDRSAFLSFVRGDYLHDLVEKASNGAGEFAPPPRTEVVRCLLQSLVEVCALVRLPVVFAFDNLEGLFSPTGMLNGDLIKAFFSNLAQAIDNTKGFLFLIFAENGLYQTEIVDRMGEFARDRLAQGVPLVGRGPMALIDLHPPTAEEMKALVRARVGTLLADFPEKQQLPDEFPFPTEFLEKEFADSSRGLRNSIQRLRDEYSEVVYSRVLPPEPAARGVIDWKEALEAAWQNQLKLATPKLYALTNFFESFHAGLGTLLQRLMPLQAGDWTLAKVQPTVSVGDNATYGIATILTWNRKADAANGAGEELRTATAFLLAGGPGMAADLRSKFDVFHKHPKPARLIVLWPTQKGESEKNDLDPDLLPPNTRKAWDESPQHSKTTLRRVTKEALRDMAAVPGWLQEVNQALEQPVPESQVRAFLEERCSYLSSLIQPAEAPQLSLIA